MFLNLRRKDLESNVQLFCHGLRSICPGYIRKIHQRVVKICSPQMLMKKWRFVKVNTLQRISRITLHLYARGWEGLGKLLLWFTVCYSRLGCLKCSISSGTMKSLPGLEWKKQYSASVGAASECKQSTVHNLEFRKEV